MARSFYPCDRNQLMLLPPSIDDWVDQGDLSHFIVDALEEMDLACFYARYGDGSGQQAYRPEVIIGVLLLAYSLGHRSSRVIESLCANDVRFRMLTCNRTPDHCTIARFRTRHREQLEHLFVEVLRLCGAAGLVKLGVVAIDGTKVKANAAMEANRNRKQLAEMVEKMFGEAEDTDAREDELFGKQRRGDELPDELQTPASRRARLRAAKEQLARTDKAYRQADEKARAHINKYDETLARQEEKQAATGNKHAGHKIQPPPQTTLDEPKANLTDPDSLLVKDRRGYLQGYNAQAAVTGDTQVIVAADVVSRNNDMHELGSMITTLCATLAAAQIPQAPSAILADAGYWTPRSIEAAQEIVQTLAPQSELLVAVPPKWQKLAQAPVEDSSPPGQDLLVRLEHRQRSPAGQSLYRIRAQSVEPVFGTLKSARKLDRFSQRGIENVRAEWMLACATHNLLKLWKHHNSNN